MLHYTALRKRFFFFFRPRSDQPDRHEQLSGRGCGSVQEIHRHEEIRGVGKRGAESDDLLPGDLQRLRRGKRDQDGGCGAFLLYGRNNMLSLYCMPQPFFFFLASGTVNSIAFLPSLVGLIV